MRRLLTGHVQSYNRQNRRHGHLFQNLYKSILCQDTPYLLELVRYIHLNPMGTGLVYYLEHLDKYPFSGHGVIMGVYEHPWQNSDAILAFFGGRTSLARCGYRAFVTKGIEQGNRPDLTGGGLIRSAGGWGGRKRNAQIRNPSEKR